MFYILQKRPILQLVIVLALCAFLGLRLFSASISYDYFWAALPFSGPLASAVSLHNDLFRGLMLIFIVIEALLLYSFFKKGKFTDNHTFFPVVWLLFFYAFGSFLLPFTPIFITNVAVVLLVTLNSVSQNSKVAVLMSGVVVGLASLYDISAVLLLVYVFISLIISKLNWIRDIVVSLVGFLLPYIYVAAGFYFHGTFGYLISSMQQISIQPYLFASPHFSPISLACLAVFVLFLPYAFLQLKLLADNKLVVIRNRYISLNFLMLVLFCMALFSPIPLPYSLSYLTVPLAMYLSALIPEKRFSIFKELTISLFVASVVLLNLGL